MFIKAEIWGVCAAPVHRYIILVISRLESIIIPISQICIRSSIEKNNHVIDIEPNAHFAVIREPIPAQSQTEVKEKQE